MKFTLLFAVSLLVLVVPDTVQAQGAFSKEITASDVKKHVVFLAGDDLKGRLTGTEECEEAALYLKKNFAEFGLQAFPGKDWFQKYDFIAGMKKGTENKLAFLSGTTNTETTSSDFSPASFSGSGNFSGELVFVGYGISAPKQKYDDYENLDVKGKIVLAIRYHPEYANPHSEFDDLASFRLKATIAKEKGAKAILFINGPQPKMDEDKLPEFKFDRAGQVKDFGVAFVKRAVIEKLLTGSTVNLAALQDSISKNKKPGSFAITGVTVNLTTDVQVEKKEGINVIAYLEGIDPLLKQEYMVIGGHFDHLGMGVDGSLYRGADPLVHNGADDNASGTAGVLELAQKMAAEKSNKRSVIFIAFSGEELGLLGSSYYVNNSFVPVEKIAVMINLDMIGRLNNEKSLIVYGTGTSLLWKSIIDSLNTPYAFKLTKNDEGYGPSDHSSFYSKNIPVLFFFTGTHEDYHRPSDDADKVNADGEEAVLKYVYDIAGYVANNQVKPDYVNVPRKAGEKTSGGWKVYVGTIPDYAYQGEGLKITGASEGSPAKKAGLLAGDIILKFGDKKIGNIYDYVYALKGLVPGDVVPAVIKRGEAEIKTTIVVGAK